MDKENRQFITALNTTKKTININKITLNDIIEAYDRLARKYNDFIKSQGYTEKAEESKLLKRQFDRLYKYWIDPFNIALRNQIGSIGLPKMNVTKIYADAGNKATLSIETIKKIRKKYNLDMETKKFNITSKEDFVQILNDLLHIGTKKEENNEATCKKEAPILQKKEKIPYEVSSDILTKYKVNSSEELVVLIYSLINNNTDFKSDSALSNELKIVETYTFYTGIAEQLKSFITKYEFTVDYNEKKCTKEIYGDIDLKRYYSDKMYRRIVLEAIEDLEIENYRNKTTNKYIGSFKSYIRNGKIEWKQIISQGELEAIKKIEIMDERARNEKISRNNEGVFR